jgi:polyhydroxyalkanoate synthesis regulator phasin
MKKRLIVMAMICIVLIGFNTRVPQAAEVDILINKLVEKGVITQDEATQLMDEMRKEGARENEAIKAVVAEAAKEEAKHNKQVLPSWVENMTLSGDFRVRYQTEDVDNDGKPSRNRWRIRLRPGLDAKINDQWKVGFGLATGSDDPISTNQTLENEFQTPDIRLDYAYAQYSPTKDIRIIAGKLKNPLYTTKDLMWDGDARPDGLAATFNFKASDKMGFFITPAYFILEEFSTSKDPAMIVFQAGMNLNINDNVKFKVAGTYYDFKNVKGSDMSVWSQKTNSYTKTVSNAGQWNEKATYYWVYDHDSTAFDAELTAKFDSFIKYASLFGEYVNSDADTNNTGWLAGITFGDEKVNELGKWQFIYNYRELEKDGWVDWLPDSDFYGGKTGVKGSEFEFTIGLYKNVTFGFDYYISQPIDNSANMDMSLLQADLVIKF